MYVLTVRFLSYIKKRQETDTWETLSGNPSFPSVFCSDRKKIKSLKVKWENRSLKTHLLVRS